MKVKIELNFHCAFCGCEMEGILHNMDEIKMLPCLNCLQTTSHTPKSPKFYNDVAKFYGYETRWQDGHYYDSSGLTITREKWKELRNND